MASCIRLSPLLPISQPANPKADGNVPCIHFPSSSSTIRCGPRGNRGPLLRGRILSIEAIQAVQSLKRARHKSIDPSQYSDLLSKIVTRLIKFDLIAAVNELLRQNQCHLAVELFSAARSESWYRADLGVYANLAIAMKRNEMRREMEQLVFDLEREEIRRDDKGMVRLVKTVIDCGSVESAVKIYEVIKKSGWMGDVNVLKVLGNGLRRMGKEEIADEMLNEYHRLSKPNWRKLDV